MEKDNNNQINKSINIFKDDLKLIKLNNGKIIFKNEFKIEIDTSNLNNDENDILKKINFLNKHFKKIQTLKIINIYETNYGTYLDQTFLPFNDNKISFGFFILYDNYILFEFKEDNDIYYIEFSKLESYF